MQHALDVLWYALIVQETVVVHQKVNPQPAVCVILLAKDHALAHVRIHVAHVPPAVVLVHHAHLDAALVMVIVIVHARIIAVVVVLVEAHVLIAALVVVVVVALGSALLAMAAPVAAVVMPRAQQVAIQHAMQVALVRRRHYE